MFAVFKVWMLFRSFDNFEDHFLGRFCRGRICCTCKTFVLHFTQLVKDKNETRKKCA